MVLVIVKAFNILEFVARDPTKAHSLTEIAEAMQLHQATCANILKTLVEINYLEHLGRKKGYRLGSMAYNLTNNSSNGPTLVLAAAEVMEELTRRLNETSILGVIRNYKRYIIHLVNSDQDLQVRSRSERNVYETASGRILLAFMPEKERASFVQVVGLPSASIWPGAETVERLEQALAEIRKNELVITHSPSHIVGFAVPIRKGEQVVASLSIFLPEIRCSTERKRELIIALRDASSAISDRLK
ncbi:transcriptional regulator, IclR family [Fibrisoma limi BUZ 3]|uniref:Transcriptional regulator, IclR family n=1 Tax=Fibrisoma limi BUZ 3 TaxID=1185876 RepID=I2GHS1_9BACT|nr:IclR family transcriptional regulator [Fibrisoma limi]CCH53446.1 transcriptional regulator, IclR family [Fibrisoma limi BUZ 3]